MTEGQLALVRHVLEQARGGNEIVLTNDEKVDIDSAHTYFNNLLLDIEKDRKRIKVGKSTIITYTIHVVVTNA